MVKEEREEWDLGIGDVGVLADLGGDGGAELGDRNDVVEVVDFHDGWQRSASCPEEIEDSLPRFLQTRRVRRHFHVPKRVRHSHLHLLTHLTTPTSSVPVLLHCNSKWPIFIQLL